MEIVLKPRLLFIIPPLTQLNTPYPSTAYLTYFLKNQKYDVVQVDLGLELILKIFSAKGLQQLFESVSGEMDENSQFIFSQKERYITTIDAVINFLQNKNPTLAHRICSRNLLPEGPRIQNLHEDLETHFGTLGITDKAKFFATLYLEDLGDFITKNVDEGFGFSRYQEKISIFANSYDSLHEKLRGEASYCDKILLALLAEKIAHFKPTIAGLTVPFPGNLYGALRCAQQLKKEGIKVILGGGYVNTELRDLTEKRLFECVDYVTLDDGELPILQILKKLYEDPQTPLCRTFILNKTKKVEYQNNSVTKDFSPLESGMPDYSGLPMSSYLSILETANPMHRLWNDGTWNKLTLAHGCYWRRCSFCDVTLDYIDRYDEAPAKILVDRMESIMAQTGQSGFHFVDEAAPPKLLQELSLEILKRNLVVSWWTNVRFERAFSEDVCRLMARAGCIAVSGGLEVASDRLLRKMKKGTNLQQVAQVTQAYKNAGILVHAYLMFGFPSQTEQETIDALEVVRQLFDAELLQSAFWHQFALTAHSPIAKNPDEYGITITGPEFKGFALNELYYLDKTGCDHARFAPGLRRALYNYMHGIGIDEPLDFWFDFPVPTVSCQPNLIIKKAEESSVKKIQAKSRLLWLAEPPLILSTDDSESEIRFANETLVMAAPLAEWLQHLLPQLNPHEEPITFAELQEFFSHYFHSGFEEFIAGEIWQSLRDNGLIIL